MPLLLDRGADVDARNWNQATSARENLDVAEILLKQVWQEQVVVESVHILAAREGYYDVGRLLLDCAADVNTLHWVHWSAFHLAAFKWTRGNCAAVARTWPGYSRAQTT